jgi:hypothetical protein
LELLDPRLRALERLRVGHVVRDHGRGRAAIVHGRETVIPLLPCCVPDLELDRVLLVDDDALGEEGGCAGVKGERRAEGNKKGIGVRWVQNSFMQMARYMRDILA